MRSTDIQSILACPNCLAPLSSLDACGECSSRFAEIGRVRSFLPVHATRRVSFDFTSARSIRGLGFEGAFKYPERLGADDANPYHLDAAHLAIIEKLSPGSVVLEIGCGGGQMREFLSARDIRYVGTDISANERVTEDLKIFGGPDILADAHFLPFRDGVFDLVYSAAVTEHLASPFLAAQEAFRVLKPGGAYLGNCSFMEPWHDDSFFHMSPLGAWELLTQAGFDVDNIWPGKGYSGYRALMRMGNRATEKLSFFGEALYGLYGLGLSLRSLAGRGERTITDDARVAGATDWIARRPRD